MEYRVGSKRKKHNPRFPLNVMTYIIILWLAGERKFCKLITVYKEQGKRRLVSHTRIIHHGNKCCAHSKALFQHIVWRRSRIQNIRYDEQANKQKTQNCFLYLEVATSVIGSNGIFMKIKSMRSNDTNGLHDTKF